MKLNNKALLFLVIPLLIPAALLLPKKEPTCSDKVEVNIGNFSTRAAGQRASLNQLAHEIKRCPKAQKFRILRNTVGLRYWTDREYELTFYDRKNGFLQDGMPIYGPTTQWMKVKDKAIINVASASERFSDFAKYGAVDAMP